MYSSPAIDYLIRKRTLQKHRFIIKTKIIIASYITFALYLLIRYFGHSLMKAGHFLMNIEPIIYIAVAALVYSVYSISFKRE